MKRLINPFRFVAGGKALCWGTAIIAAQTAWLCALGYYQNSYLHFGPAPAPHALLRTAAAQAVCWIVPALLLAICGAWLSKSKIRPIDILGTTALAQAPLALLLLPLSIPGTRALLDRSAESAMTGSLPSGASMAIMLLFGLWSLAALALFFIRNYQAYSVSCNLRGAWAVGSYIAVVVTVTILTQFVRL